MPTIPMMPMIPNALLASCTLLLALLFYLMSACRFLIPYRRVILHDHGALILLSTAVLFVNVFALVYSAGRVLGLKDTGRKLAHLDKQLHSGAPSARFPARWGVSGGPIARDLADKLED
jgi:hypothetical protein